MKDISHNIFSLSESDKYVGSYISEADLCLILNINKNDLTCLKPVLYNNILYYDEYQVQKALSSNNLKASNTNLCECICIKLIEQAFPEAVIETQIQVKKFKMDILVTDKNHKFFLEFDGPSHFIYSRYGIPKEPFRKKKLVEDLAGIKVINFGFWIQRCSRNIKAIVDNNIQGRGAIWNSKILFQDFYFKNSADIILEINKQFNIKQTDITYFYGQDTQGRNIQEHPMVQKVLDGAESIDRFIPLGACDPTPWVPLRLKPHF
jgi:very-short-patch-repair endonuclease